MAKCLFQSGGGGGKSNLKVVTAGSDDVLKGKVIVDANGNPLTGTIESMGAQTITPSNTNKTVSCNGKYMTGDVSVKGDSNLVAGNIISGKTIFGVAGNVKKLVTRMGEGICSNNRVKYNYYPNENDTFYQANVTLDFYPRAYGYKGKDNKQHGIYDEFGTFRVQFSQTAWDVLVDSCLITGNTINFPLYGKTNINWFAAGYY